MPSYDLSKVLEPIYDILDEKLVNAMIYVAAERAGATGLRLVLRAYPPLPPGPGAPSPLRTPKQWRWWWSSMRDIAEGKPVSDSLRGWKARYVKVGHHRELKISGHYKRTGTLVRSISFDVEQGGGATTIHIGPSMARGIHSPETTKAGEYARYVIGKRDQAPIHKGRWKPLLDVVEGHSKEIVQAFLRAFAGEVKREVKRRADIG